MEHQHDADDPALRIPNRSGAILDRAFRSRLGNQHRVIGQPGDGSLAENFFDRIQSRQASVLVDDFEHCHQRLALRLLLAPAGELLRDGVQKRDIALGVGGDHAVADAGQRRAKPFALVANNGGISLPSGHAAIEIPDEAAEEQQRQRPAVASLTSDQT